MSIFAQNQVLEMTQDIHTVDAGAESRMLNRRIRRAAHRHGAKANCAECGEEWFKVDMKQRNGNLLCPICNSLK